MTIYLYDLEHLDGQENCVNAAKIFNTPHKRSLQWDYAYTNIIFETVSTQIEVGECGKHAVIS